jgi:NADPH:quinone reductase-like Zn-dependent oxidoreductase
VVEQLHWRPVDVGTPAQDQVEIEVAATGLNFMNLLSALGAPGGSTAWDRSASIAPGACVV